MGEQNIKNQNHYSLDSIAGYKEEKAEAVEIINLFKNFEHFKSLGVSIPKGLILSGRPGVGKTLMAKVISAESNVSFYEYEAADGDTLKKSINSIRSIYEEARKNAPAIVFIDELDELITSREYISDISRVMLKTLLTEIDGVKSSDGILTIATTNHYDYIPPALKRSGRMDKHISFDLPDIESREAILLLYAKDKELLKGIDFKDVSAKTDGFSGADLKNLINEVLLKAITAEKQTITNSDFNDIIPTVAFKGIRRAVNKPPLDNVCYHELGHFICELELNKMVSSLSVERIGQIEGHISPYSMYNRGADNLSFTQCKNKAIVCLGGYAAEKVFMNQTYTGVLDDFGKFESIIKLMASTGMFGAKDIFRNNGFKNQFYIIDEESQSQTSIDEDDVRVKCFDEYLGIAINIVKDNKKLIEFLFGKLKEAKKIDAKKAKELIKEFNSKQQ